MKKALYIFAALCLIVSLAACAADPREEQPSSLETETSSLESEVPSPAPETSSLEQSDAAEREKNEIVGEWKAMKTDSDQYFLQWLFGTSLKTSNRLQFNEDGSYTLYLGFTFLQEGKYHVSGTTITLTDNAYTGDLPDHEIAKQLVIDGQNILLKTQADDGTAVNIIFENVRNLPDGAGGTAGSASSGQGESHSAKEASSTTAASVPNGSQANAKGLQIGSKTVKFGTYRGVDAATGDVLVLKSDGTAVLNGVTYRITVEKHNFAQDISYDDWQDAVILVAESGGSDVMIGFVGDDGRLINPPNAYEYAGN